MMPGRSDLPPRHLPHQHDAVPDQFFVCGDNNPQLDAASARARPLVQATSTRPRASVPRNLKDRPRLLRLLPVHD